MVPYSQVALLIVVALPDERDGVLAVSDGASEPAWTLARDESGFKLYHREFRSHQGAPFRVAVARTQAMGGPGAAATSSRLLAELKPRFIAMCGVCAGRPDKTRLGDLIIADRLFEADAGKVVRNPEGTAELFRDMTTFNLDPRWKEHIEDERRRWAREAKIKWLPFLGDAKPHEDRGSEAVSFEVHIGPLATVYNVTQDSEAFPRIARVQRSVLGLEMEGAAMGFAAHIGSTPLLVAKAVQDFADDSKSDRYRGFACRISAEFVVDFFRWAVDQAPTSAQSPLRRERVAQPESTLREIARVLLDDALPGSLQLLFPDASPPVRMAIDELSRSPRRVRRLLPPDKEKSSKDEIFLSLAELAARRGRFLVLAPPGSGKTHALWHAADAMLHAPGLIPIYVSGGRFATWTAILKHLSERDLDPLTTFRDGRVVVFFDGWTEFGAGDPHVHRDALLVLANTTMVATGRHSAPYDARFESFALEPLPGHIVQSVLVTAFPSQPTPPPSLLEILRLPIALLLHILLGGQAGTRGDMIARLHERLIEARPDALTSALATAAARTALDGNEQRRGVFESELRLAGAALKIPNALDLTRSLGTLGSDLREPRPVHDLYWNWLVGVGLIESAEILRALPRLNLRDSLNLAVESGSRVDDATLQTLRTRDVELATQLAVAAEPAELATQIEAMLVHYNDAIKRRGVIAGLRCRDGRVFREALRVRSELATQGCLFDIDGELDMNSLWGHRSEVAAWADGHSVSELLGAVAECGDDRWLPWLQRLASSGRAPAHIAAATAIACCRSIPGWVEPHLSTLFEHAWLLRPAASRGANVELARWVAANYAELLAKRPNSSLFIELNRILVSCADDAVFANLLSHFWDIPGDAHHALSYAIVERGDPWVGAFQKVAFAGDHPLPKVYKLYEHVSNDVDDETARAWIEKGPEVLGWRVLVKRHGNGVLTEMIKALPDSFSNLNTIPPLRAMADLEDPPEYLVDEIWKRVCGTISPIAVEDIIRALMRVRLKGILSLIAFQQSNIRALPNLSFNRFLLEYYKWERDTGLSAQINDDRGIRDFGEWIRLARWSTDQSDRLVGHYLVSAALPVSDDVLDAWAAGDRSLRKFVRISAPLGRYHAAAVSTLLASPDGFDDILYIFGTALSQFPQQALLELLNKALSEQQLHALLSAVEASNEPANRRFHACLLSRYFAQPPIDVHTSQKLAGVLRVHPLSVIREMLDEQRHSPAGLWLLRDIEKATGIRMVDENGDWLA